MSDKSLSKELNLIGEGTIVEGTIRTKGNLRIDGKVHGDVQASENLALGAGGEIVGSVTGKNVVIGGRVKGNVTSAGKLVLETKCVVQGDIHAERLVIDEGAVFDGRVAMTEKPSMTAAVPVTAVQGGGIQAQEQHSSKRTW